MEIFRSNAWKKWCVQAQPASEPWNFSAAQDCPLAHARGIKTGCI
jgi:hypothetical protein